MLEEMEKNLRALIRRIAREEISKYLSEIDLEGFRKLAREEAIKALEESLSQ